MLYCKPPFAFQCHMGYGGKTSMAGWVLVFFFSKQTLDLWNQCQHHITKHANNILFNAVDAWRSTAHAGWISWLIIIFSSNIYCIWMYMMMLPFNPPFIVDFPICSYVFLFFSNLSCMSPYFHPLAICPRSPRAGCFNVCGSSEACAAGSSTGTWSEQSNIMANIMTMINS